MDDKRDLRDLFGEVIHVHTRADAIADGMLVDVSAVAREAGIRFPVALTRAIWERCVRAPTALPARTRRAGPGMSCGC
jgi:hypothetical protein